MVKVILGYYALREVTFLGTMQTRIKPRHCPQYRGQSPEGRGAASRDVLPKTVTLRAAATEPVLEHRRVSPCVSRRRSSLAPKAADFASAVAALETPRPSPADVHASLIAPLLIAAARATPAFGRAHDSR